MRWFRKAHHSESDSHIAAAAIVVDHDKQRFPSVIRTLQRQSLAGWLIASVLMIILAAMVVLQSLKQPVILTINEQGQLVGQLEVFHPGARNETEILAFSKHFLTMHLSLNSATIYDDAATALTMMTPKLRQKWLERYRQNNYIQTLEQSSSRGELRFSSIELLSRNAEAARVLLQGNVELEGRTALAFKVGLQLKMIPRTIAYPYGIRVVEIIDL